MIPLILSSLSNKVGTMYWFGRGVPQDQTEALRWFELGASKGDMDARHNVVYARPLQRKAAAQ
jgi:TPR repeat protein